MKNTLKTLARELIYPSRTFHTDYHECVISYDDTIIRQTITCCGRHESENVGRVVLTDSDLLILVLPNNRFKEGDKEYKRIKLGYAHNRREAFNCIERALEYMDKLLTNEMDEYDESNEYDIDISNSKYKDI